MLKIAPPPGSIELKMEREFPAEKEEAQDLYLAKPEALAVDIDGSVYVADIQADTVYKFDRNGDFVFKFGRPGQGPGDLSAPMRIFIEDDHIVVLEAKNRRLQYFGKDGKPWNKIIKITHSQPNAFQSGLIYGTPMVQGKSEKEYLIEISSEEGRLINKFGDPIWFKFDAYILNNTRLFPGKEKTISVVFKHLPIIRKYRETGELISERRLEYEMSKEKERYNKEMNANRPNTGGAYIEIVHQADMTENGLFLYDYVPPRIWIRQADEDGAVKATYWAHVGDKYSETAFKVRRENGAFRFYVLESSPEAKVQIFGIK